jgi:RHS repeat-associated protein
MYCLIYGGRFLHHRDLLVLRANKFSEMRYKPWGEVRHASGSGATKYQYTGQYSDSYINLLWYNSRHYDPELGRFIAPDTIVPFATQGMQAWDRYGYANNNPVRYTDPSGHCVGPWILLCFVGGVVAAAASVDLVEQKAYETKENRQIVEEINNNSPTSVDALANLFLSDSFGGENAEDRFTTILGATQNSPGLYFSETFDDSGFKKEFRDPNSGSRNQVGHFLTAAGISYRASDNPFAQPIGLSIVIGHEMYPDPEGIDYLTFVKQGWAGRSPNIHQLFLSGENRNFKIIMEAGKNGNGNSIQDLRLSYQGWKFGNAIRNGSIKSRNDAANWIYKYLAE